MHWSRKFLPVIPQSSSVGEYFVRASLSSHIVGLSVFRELLQNSDDAGCDTTEIHFKTAAFSGRDPKATKNTNDSMLPELETTDVRTIYHFIVFLLMLDQGQTMDFQKSWETIHTARLGATSENWFELALASRSFGLITDPSLSFGKSRPTEGRRVWCW